MITISTLIAVPAIAAVVLLVVPFARQAAGYLALLVSLAVLGAVIGFIYRFEPVAGYQFADNVSWIEPLGVRWHVAVNGVSLAMIAVTALITTCALGFALWAKRDRSHASAALILMTEAFLFLVFAARDLGYLEKEGITLDLVDFKGGGPAVQALAGGSIDICFCAADHVIRLRARKQPARRRPRRRPPARVAKSSRSCRRFGCSSCPPRSRPGIWKNTCTRARCSPRADARSR
jgi:hypothetical protein